jgi:hypothetical protein
MGLKLKRGLELFFQKLWTKLLFIFFLCFLHCSIIFNVQRTFVAFKFVCPTTQKLFNLINEWRKYWKCSMINTWWWVVLPYHSKICSFFKTFIFGIKPMLGGSHFLGKVSIPVLITI